MYDITGLHVERDDSPGDWARHANGVILIGNDLRGEGRDHALG